MQNLQQKVPPQAWPEFKALVADMRDAPTVTEAERRRQAIVAEYHLDFPEACRCLLEDGKASLSHLQVPPRHQQYVRTSNLAERAFEEERRRTKVIPQLWDEGGLVKLVFAVLIRVSDRWGKKCFSEFAQQQIRNLRRQLKLDGQAVSVPNLRGGNKVRSFFLHQSPLASLFTIPRHVLLQDLTLSPTGSPPNS
jgi:transposase-like protein